MIFEIFVFLGPLYGWASMFFIFHREGYYQYLCSEGKYVGPSMEPSHNFTLAKSKPMLNYQSRDGVISTCADQDQALNLVFILVVLLTRTAAFFAGLMTDAFGPRASRMTGVFLFVLSGISWLFLSHERPWIIYVGCLSMAIAGYFCLIALIQIGAYFFHEKQASVVSLQSGAYDGSAVVALFFKLIYDAEISLNIQSCFTIFCAIATFFVVLTTYTIVPPRQEYKRVSEKYSSKLMDDDKESTALVSMKKDKKDLPCKQDNRQYKNTNENEKTPGAIPSSDAAYLNSNFAESDEKLPLVSVKTFESNSFKADKNKVSSRSNNETTLDKKGIKEIAKLMSSGFYLWQLWFVCLTMLKTLFYITSFHNLICQLTTDKKVLGKYVNGFGIAQFFGIVFAPLVGPYVDGISLKFSNLCPTTNPPSNPQESTQIDDTDPGPGSKVRKTMERLKRCTIAIFTANTIGILLEVTSLLPYLEVQYISMLCQVILRGLLFALDFVYFAIVMPARHYGKLLSSTLMTAGAFTCIQYPLLEVVENKVNGDPFWIHVGLLVISLLTYGQPIYIWWKCFRNEKE